MLTKNGTGSLHFHSTLRGRIRSVHYVPPQGERAHPVSDEALEELLGANSHLEAMAILRRAS